jgi:hypothetical protein
LLPHVVAVVNVEHAEAVPEHAVPLHVHPAAAQYVWP